MSKPLISPQDGEAAVLAASAEDPGRQTLATACRYLLQLLEERHPGHSVEVRVPPFGAVQCVEGPRHTRGTPPNVIETDPATWVALGTGAMAWEHAVERGLVHASGVRATLDGLIPILPPVS